MNIVAQMLVRNEADVIEETVHEIFRWVDTLVVLDGASTDGTTEKLNALTRALAGSGKTLDCTSRPDPGGRFADHYRNELLRLTAPFEPDWVISVDADEIYDQHSTSPIQAIMAAEKVGANVVRSWVPEFWLTFDDLRRGALHEDESVSVQERRAWYSWGHTGIFIWKWHPDHYYPADTPKRTPETPGMNHREWQRIGPIFPVCKHYPIRGLRQGMVRMEERLSRGGGKYFGKYKTNWIVDERLADLYRYRPGLWHIVPNHGLLKDYMAGRLNK